MLFTKEEIRRLEEWVTWGIEKKNLQNEDFRSAQKKLRELLAVEEQMSLLIAEPKRRVTEPETEENTRKVVAFLTSMIQGRPLTKEEGAKVREWLELGSSYELIRFAWGAAVKNCGGASLGYMDALIRRELGKEAKDTIE